MTVPGTEKNSLRGATGGPRGPHVPERSPKWSQKGGPGPSQNGSCAQAAEEMAEYAICTLFAMFQQHKPLWKSIVFPQFLLSQTNKNRGSAPRPSKSLPNGRPGQHTGTQCRPHGGPRLPRTPPEVTKIMPAALANGGLGPGCTPKAAQGTPGLQKVTKIDGNCLSNGTPPSRANWR